MTIIWRPFQQKDSTNSITWSSLSVWTVCCEDLHPGGHLWLLKKPDSCFYCFQIGFKGGSKITVSLFQGQEKRNVFPILSEKEKNQFHFFFFRIKKEKNGLNHIKSVSVLSFFFWVILIKAMLRFVREPWRSADVLLFVLRWPGSPGGRQQQGDPAEHRRRPEGTAASGRHAALRDRRPSQGTE